MMVLSPPGQEAKEEAQDKRPMKRHRTRHSRLDIDSLIMYKIPGINTGNAEGVGR